jgi:hypothetical protein
MFASDDTSFIQGSISAVQFSSCSDTITGLFKGLDDFSFGTTTKLLKISPDFDATDYDTELMRSALTSIVFFESLRTNECVNGIFVGSKHMYTLQTLPGESSVRCLVLGETSYFKIAGEPSSTEYSFILHITGLVPIQKDGFLKYSLDDEIATVEISSGGMLIAKKDVVFGTTECLSLFRLKYCFSWSVEDSSGRRLADEAPGKLYLEVDGKKTESIVIWDGFANTSNLTSNTPSTLAQEAQYSGSSVLVFTALIGACIFS